ncbi:MAG: ferritin-like domain-containing protein [Deltaproteobacteria bacterium]|nr:ferritin-like domain-containing protein [Deltaproteobacteria bacterium]MBI3386639.1 ferritin-like domain-containing protein [Deltaproteobacteria bacterium]
METSAIPLASIAIDGGDLPLGGGLLALVRPALDRFDPGGVLAVLSSSRAVREDLPSWCRVERHEYLGCEATTDGRDRHLIQRGTHGVAAGDREHGITLPQRDGRLTAADMLAAVPMPPHSQPTSGFAPRGAVVEPGGPAYPFTLLERDHVAPPEVAMLYDQAVAAQWDATRDIPWHTVRPLPDALEAAVGQVMTFLAENELAALYVPANFLPRIHPAYVEVAMFLASQLADEARHIDVFLKRARAGGGGVGMSSATTSRSLHSLLTLTDFSGAAFLLSVLGEGTFLDLLRFVEEHAPDDATAELTRRARTDEARHVHFGIAHVSHGLAHDPTLAARLEAAVRRRAATLHDAGGAPAPLIDALTILAARGTDPRAIARGHEAVRELLHTMHEARTRRLQSAGFTAEQAEILSELHTPNFM